MKRIIFVVGTRPNFVKAAPLLRYYRSSIPAAKARIFVVHTGQHYDAEMSGSFLKQLGIGRVHRNLNSGSASHSRQTAKIMTGFETICLELRPDLVVVFGDVNSTLACALAAKKLGIRVCHIEAGLRSGDRSMPEEINRIATDAISDLFFTTCREAGRALLKENVPAGSICFAGNLMIDSLRRHWPAPQAGTKKTSGEFALLTLHRPVNVDSRPGLAGLLEILRKVSGEIKLCFPCHPRTRANLRKFRLLGYFGSRFALRPPADYAGMLRLYGRAAFVLTDSGCVQEETTALGLPCLTLRKNTERPITVSIGTNTLVGTDETLILRNVRAILTGKYKKGGIPELWDGKAAGRIWDRLLKA